MLSVGGAYRTLGVRPTDSAAVVQAAYRRLARRWHPDLNPAAEAAERMKRLNLAYEVVSTSLRQSPRPASPPPVDRPAGVPRSRPVPSPRQVTPKPRARPIVPRQPPMPRAELTTAVTRPRSSLWVFGWGSAFAMSAAWLWLMVGGLWFALPAGFCLWAVLEWQSSRSPSKLGGGRS